MPQLPSWASLSASWSSSSPSSPSGSGACTSTAYSASTTSYSLCSSPPNLMPPLLCFFFVFLHGPHASASLTFRLPQSRLHLRTHLVFLVLFRLLLLTPFLRLSFLLVAAIVFLIT